MDYVSRDVFVYVIHLATGALPAPLRNLPWFFLLHTASFAESMAHPKVGAEEKFYASMLARSNK